MLEQAVILVGGRGERLNDGFRYNPVEEIPKPLVEVGGKPFLTYAINSLKLAGIRDITLIVGYKKESFEFLRDRVVKLVDTRENVNEAVWPLLKYSTFILLNGDCYPILDWEKLIQNAMPRVPVKPNLRDAGVAIVSSDDIKTSKLSVQNIFAMMSIYPLCLIQGGLHIGTYQGLERARQYMDLVAFGQ